MGGDGCENNASLPMKRESEPWTVELLNKQPSHRQTMPQDLPEFYELHLIILSVICFLSLLADRYLVGSTAKQNVKDDVDERLLESGKGSSSLATLMRKYLVVYGIVMSLSPGYSF